MLWQSQVFGLDWKASSRYLFLCQSLLQATIAASRQASSPNTSTPQQTTTTQPSVSNCSLTHISKPPSHPLPCSFSSLSFRKAGSQGSTASKNAGNTQDEDNFGDLGCYHCWWPLRRPEKVSEWERPLSWKVQHWSIFAEALGIHHHRLGKDWNF